MKGDARDSDVCVVGRLKLKNEWGDGARLSARRFQGVYSSTKESEKRSTTFGHI